MSRRLRIEDEKTRQLKDELQEEEDKIKLMQERIFGPLVWKRFQNGIKIEDLQENRFNDAIEFILQWYIKEDILFRNTKMADDELSQRCFAERLIFKLKDRASIIAIDENNDNAIAGVLVLTPVQKCDFGRVYSRAMLVEGKSYKSITDFINYINRKVDVFEEFHCDIYLRYYLLCISPEYRGRGVLRHLLPINYCVNNSKSLALGLQMMLVGLDVARHLKIPVATGIFNNYRIQTIARKIGIDRILFEYSYVKWVDKNGELVFCDPGHGNYTCNVQAGLVPPPPKPDPTPVVHDKEAKVKMTRAEKKKAKVKADAKKK